MLVIFHGPDSYSRHQALQRLRAELDRDGMLGANTTVLDAKGLTLPALTMVCDAAPFLSAHRLVHVQGLLARAEAEPAGAGRRGRRGNPARGGDEGEGWLALVDYVERMPPTTVLVLEDGELRSGNPLLAALEPKARVEGFPRLSPRQLEGWIARRARELGVLFDKPALTRLAEATPSDLTEDRQWHGLWWLATEIEKLTLFAGGGRITEDDVERLVPAVLQTRVYALADAVVRREPEVALTALERLLMAGQPAPVLLAAIAGRLRQLLLLRELLAAGAPEPEIRERLGLRNPAQFDILRRQAQALSPTRLETAYLRVLDADRALKGGRMDDVTVLETLVAELAG
jgi:DNA polymerase III delta subunit